MMSGTGCVSMSLQLYLTAALNGLSRRLFHLELFLYLLSPISDGLNDRTEVDIIITLVGSNVHAALPERIVIQK